MPPLVDPTRCDGCPHEVEPPCVLVCPGDLMVLDAERKKAYCREEADCWDCMTCVKVCPRQALRTRLSYQLADVSADLRPEVAGDHITWTLVDCRGRVERFTVRTLNPEPEGSSNSPPRE